MSQLKIVYCPVSNTIRQMPQNYLIAYWRDGRWLVEPDLACNRAIVCTVTSVLMAFDSKYNNDGESVVNYCEQLMALAENDENGACFKSYY